MKPQSLWTLRGDLSIADEVRAHRCLGSLFVPVLPFHCSTEVTNRTYVHYLGLGMSCLFGPPKIPTGPGSRFLLHGRFDNYHSTYCLSASQSQVDIAEPSKVVELFT